MGLAKIHSILIRAVTFPANKKLRVLFRITAVTATLSLVSLAIFFVHSYQSYAKLIDERMAHGYLVSRAGIYAAPRTLRPGQKYSPDQLAAILKRAGYVESDAASEIWNGSFTVGQKYIDIRPTNAEGNSESVRVTFDEARILNLTRQDVPLQSFALAPESLTNDAVTKGGIRSQLSFTDIPPVLVKAITSIEDRRFFDHSGLDVWGVTRALLRNVGDESRLVGSQGGSTITQQLIKNTYLTPERTFRRKFAEAMLAFTLERRLSKQDIFALYCNEVFLGQRGAMTVRGVHQAARVYFGKDLNELTLSQAATIAGMIQSPSRYSPVRAGEAARVRRNTVLGTMVRDGFVTLDQAAQAAKEPLNIADFNPASESVAPYFLDYANRMSEARAAANVKHNYELEDAAQQSQLRQEARNPQVTTLDLDLQRLASEAINRQLEQLDKIYKPRGLTPQAALVALDPKTGNVLAMIGGRDYAQSQLNRATDAQRQPGSVFKPFVYAAALENGMSPLRQFRDAPTEFTYAQNQKYRPANYGGAFSMQDVPMREGLVKSLNVVTVDVAMQTGLARTANIALEFGLPRPTPYPALALGTTEATPLQVATAYAVLANGGKKVRATSAPLEEAHSEQVVAPTTAFMVTDMLEDVIDHGTARAARGAVKGTAVAGKTGTSRDGWFVGYTPNLVCAVWIGFDDNRQLGLTGAEAALPAWVEFMKNAIDARPELGGESFPTPEGIVLAEVDPQTNELATGKCPMHERIAMLARQAPSSECFRHNVYFNLDEPYMVQTATINPKTSQSSGKREKSLPMEVTLLQHTQVETKQGRRFLVNEMRVEGR